MQKSEAINELAKALASAQGQYLAVKQTAKVDFTGTAGRRKYSYAPLSEVIDACRKALSENGLSIVQVTSAVLDNRFQLETVLTHSSGQWISGTMDVAAYPADPQKQGSALTYARRYALSALLGVASEEDDDAEVVKEGVKSGTVKVEQNKQAPAEHYCPVHKTTFFKTPKMKSFAHPIGDTGEWCYEPAEKPAAIKPPPAPTLPESHKDEAAATTGQKSSTWDTKSVVARILALKSWPFRDWARTALNGTPIRTDADFDALTDDQKQKILAALLSQEDLVKPQ